MLHAHLCYDFFGRREREGPGINDLCSMSVNDFYGLVFEDVRCNAVTCFYLGGHVVHVSPSERCEWTKLEREDENEAIVMDFRNGIRGRECDRRSMPYPWRKVGIVKSRVMHVNDVCCFLPCQCLLSILLFIKLHPLRSMLGEKI